MHSLCIPSVDSDGANVQEALPPPQHIPPELRSSFTATLDAIMELVDVMEPNLHKVFLLVDKEKLDEMIGIVRTLAASSSRETLSFIM